MSFIHIYDDLFEFRLDCLDNLNDESIIIGKLKIKLLLLNINESNIDNLLFDFYNYYDIPVTLSQIQNILVYEDEEYFDDINIDYFQQDDNLDNILDIIFDNMEDVVVTTDIDSLNNYPILKINSDKLEICSICQDEMINNSEYLDIDCKHIFHKECLMTYLKNYNHICPTCRNEIGKPNLNY